MIVRARVAATLVGLVTLSSCNLLVFEAPGDLQVEVVSWPDTIGVADTAVAAVTVLDQEGRTWNAQTVAWQVESGSNAIATRLR